MDLLDASTEATGPFTVRATRASVLAEIPPLVSLAIPVVAGLVGTTALSVVDSFMLGPLGEVPLAAASLTQSVLVIFYAGLYGLVGPVGILTGHAHGSGNPAAVGNVVKHGLVIGLLSGLVGALAMCALYLMLPYLGQPDEVLSALPAYWLAMSALLVPFTLQMALKLFLDSIERPWTGAFFALLPVAFVIPVNWVLIYGNLGFPALGLLGAGLGSLIAVTLGFLAMIAYLRYAPSMQPYRTRDRLDRSGFSGLARDGIPMSLQYLAEGGASAVAGVLIGLLGAVALAANQIVFSIGVLIYMAPLGLAGAVGIRIAQAYGEGTTNRVRTIGIAGLLVVTAWMLLFTVIMVRWGGPMARMFVSEPAIVATATAMFVTVGIMQVFDGLQSVGLGALRGMLDTRWPTQVSLVAYWLIALPLCVLFGFVLGLGGPGIWAGFGTGLAVAAVLLVVRFLRLTKRLESETAPPPHVFRAASHPARNEPHTRQAARAVDSGGPRPILATAASQPSAGAGREQPPTPAGQHRSELQLTVPHEASESLFQRAVDWVFGYDFFISYSHRDGLNYPRRLKSRLEQAGFKAFLDQTEYVPGLDLNRETSRQVKKSRKIVVIGRPGALRSVWVRREVEVALAGGKTPVLIDINGAIETAGADAELARIARDRHWLRLGESIAHPDGEPSSAALDELVRGFKHTRQESKRLNVFVTAAGVFAALAVAAGFAAIEAYRQKAVAEKSFAAAKQAADGLVFDIARGLRDVAGMRAESVRKILGRSEAALDKLLETDPTNASLLRSRAAMLGEFSVTYLTVGDIESAAAAARRSVEVSETLTRSTTASTADIRELGLGLTRLADTATETGDLAEARAVHEKALAVRRTLAASHPDDLAAARDVTTSLMRLGEIAETAGDMDRALSLFAEALELRKALVEAKPEWRRDLTVSYLKLGDIRLTRGETDEARSAFEGGIATARKLAEEDRTSSRNRRDLAVALQRQGNLGVKVKDPGLATRMYDECLAIFDELSSSDPDNLEWAHDVAISRFKLGQAAAISGNTAAALKELGQALEERRGLLKRSPDNHQLLTDIAENLMELAAVSEPAAQVPLLQEARTILADLKASGRTGQEHNQWLGAIDARLAQPR